MANPMTVTSYMKSLHTEVTTDCEIDNNESTRYNIQCIPTVRGHHEVSVLVNGQHVAGSPFPVYVSTQLGDPVKVWTGLEKLLDATSNSKGEIFVALNKGNTNIVKFDDEGKRIELVEKIGLVNPRGIACDDEGNIYCFDNSSNKILTCNDKAGNIQIHEIELEKSNIGRVAIAIVNQKLFMAERGITGGIKVYNKQFQHVSNINHNNMHVGDISVEVHCNLYVCDATNQCVHVFTKDGIHLHSFGHDKKELKLPWGLCVHDRVVYVMERTYDCVFVFTTDGELVTLFGHYGWMDGDFINPACIDVNKNGFTPLMLPTLVITDCSVSKTLCISNNLYYFHIKLYF